MDALLRHAPLPEAVRDYDPEINRFTLDQKPEYVAKRVLFIVSVHWSAFKRWVSIGRGPVDDTVQRGDEYIQEVGNPMICRIFDNEGNERAGTPADCIGLERAAVWEANQVEERLLDALIGRPNRWAELLKVKLP